MSDFKSQMPKCHYISVALITHDTWFLQQYSNQIWHTTANFKSKFFFRAAKVTTNENIQFRTEA